MALRFPKGTRAAAALFLIAAALAVTGDAAAQGPPPMRIYVPFAAGGPTDVVARILADLLSAH